MYLKYRRYTAGVQKQIDANGRVIIHNLLSPIQPKVNFNGNLFYGIIRLVVVADCTWSTMYVG